MERYILEKENDMNVEELADVVMNEFSYINGYLMILTVALIIVSVYLYLKVKRQDEMINDIRLRLKRSQITRNKSGN